MMVIMVVMLMTRQCTRMSQVPNIVRRLADADNLPCRIGNYAHNDNHDGGDGDKLMVMVMVVMMLMAMAAILHKNKQILVNTKSISLRISALSNPFWF